MKSNLKKSWVNGLEESRELDVRGNFAASLVMRKRLAEMLEAKIDSNRTVTRSKSSYDNPNWVYLQADANGYQRAVQEIIELIL